MDPPLTVGSKYPTPHSNQRVEVHEQRQAPQAPLQEVLRLTERRAVGLDFLEHDVPVGHVEQRKLWLELPVPDTERALHAQVELIPPLLVLRVG